VITAQEAALDMVKPGIKVSDVYATAEKELRAADLKQINAAFGHGLGVECMEKPIISKDEDMELMEGMVLNIDIPYLELGWGGVQLEDTILVTDDGFELITNTERTLYLL
jgi:Xaa-Pro aminopeptidase